MEYLKKLLYNDEYRRILVLVCIVLILFLLRNLMDLFLITFILTYLMYRLQNVLIISMKKFVRIEQKAAVIVLYLIMLAIVTVGLYTYTPKIVKQTNNLFYDVLEIYDNVPDDNAILVYIKDSFKELDFKKYIEQGFGIIIESVNNIINVFIAIVLSLFFLLERSRVKAFTEKFSESKVSKLYEDIVFIGQKFLNSFGKVIEAQILISFTNTILSIIVLSIMGFYDYILGLGIMLFVLGLIPVAGVVISLFPLSMIAYGIGGFNQVIYVIIFIIILHMIEAYVLNPKFMSLKTELPIFYTLLILIISDKVMGILGLIIGIPIFIFILEMLEVKFSSDEIKKKSIIEKVKNTKLRKE